MLFAAIWGFMINVNAQNDNATSIFQMKDGAAVVTEVVAIQGKAKADLYQDALMWVSKAFNSAKTVIQTKDSDLGLITIKSKIMVDSNEHQELYSDEWYSFILTIQAKDGRYKYEISDIVYTWDASFMNQPLVEPQTNISDSKFRKAFLSIVSSLKQQMEKPAEDW